MKGTFVGMALSAAIAAAVSGHGPAWATSSMTDYLWENRPLVLFAPDAGHPILAAQSEALEGQTEALRERNIVFIDVIGEMTTIDGLDASGLKADALRRRYGVASGEAAALLVGKDGGVKVRNAAAIESSTLFETIDAMPMRRYEMRQREKSNE